MHLNDHPTVRRVRAAPAAATPVPSLATAWLKDLARGLGADDVGLVEIDRPALDDQRHHIKSVFTATRTLLSFVVRLNREPVRSTARSVANQEFHAVYDAVNDTARRIVRALDDSGIPACNAVAAFPMEVQLPGRFWTVAHKPVAVAAGLGHMGVHRCLIHPEFGSFVLLGTVLIGAEAETYDHPLDYNPCLSCNLCVAACPVGALKSDGWFDFLTCYTHNYREFLDNFTDWVGAVADSRNAEDYRRRVPDEDTRAMWQSLSFKPGYKSSYCLAVCPAGARAITPYLEDRKDYVERVVKPLRDHPETLYVLPGSDAESDSPRRFPNKTVRRVRKMLRTPSIAAFLMSLRLGFQRGKAKGLSATYHWTFTGAERIKATIRIDGGAIAVRPGHDGRADIAIAADAATWLNIVNGNGRILPALALGRIKVKGPMALFRAFGKCFPG